MAIHSSLVIARGRIPQWLDETFVWDFICFMQPWHDVQPRGKDFGRHANGIFNSTTYFGKGRGNPLQYFGWHREAVTFNNYSEMATCGFAIYETPLFPRRPDDIVESKRTRYSNFYQDWYNRNDDNSDWVDSNYPGNGGYFIRRKTSDDISWLKAPGMWLAKDEEWGFVYGTYRRYGEGGNGRHDNH